MSKKPGVREFLAVIASDTLATASGASSVPFTALAAVMKNPPTKLLFGSLAILSFITACYKTWGRERQERNQVERTLRHERDSRPRPELFVAQEPSHSPYQEEVFVVANHGAASAVNVAVTPIQFETLTVNASVVPSVLHPGENAVLMFLLERRDEREHSMPITSVKELVTTVTGHLQEAKLSREVHMLYTNTDGRMFMTIYDLTLNYFGETATMRFRELVIYPADRS